MGAELDHRLGKFEAGPADDFGGGRELVHPAVIPVVGGKVSRKKSHGTGNDTVIVFGLIPGLVAVQLIPGIPEALVYRFHNLLEAELFRHEELGRKTHFYIPDPFSGVVHK